MIFVLCSIGSTSVLPVGVAGLLRGGRTPRYCDVERTGFAAQHRHRPQISCQRGLQQWRRQEAEPWSSLRNIASSSSVRATSSLTVKTRLARTRHPSPVSGSLRGFAAAKQAENYERSSV